MNTQVEFYEDMTSRRWHWELRISNGQESARSKKSYASKAAARKAWRTHVARIREDDIEERTIPTIRR